MALLKMLPHTRQPRNRRGFTLIELMVVILLIGLISAITFPQLLPLIYFSELEGSARHLASYGRNVIAQAMFMRDPHTVRFDLSDQEYFTVHLIYPEEEKENEEEIADQLAMLQDFSASKGFASLKDEGSDSIGSDFDQELAAEQFNDRFAKFARRGTEARAENVKHEESFLDEAGDLFDEEDEFDLEDTEEPVEEELADPLLQRTRLPGDTRIESVTVNGKRFTTGLVEVEITTLGLATKVGFHLVNSDNEYFTVVWDPLLNETKWSSGKEDVT